MSIPDDLRGAAYEASLSGFSNEFAARLRAHAEPQGVTVPVAIERNPKFIIPGDYIVGWNACRAAMLAASPEPPK